MLRVWLCAESPALFRVGRVATKSLCAADLALRRGLLPLDRSVTCSSPGRIAQAVLVRAKLATGEVEWASRAFPTFLPRSDHDTLNEELSHRVWIEQLPCALLDDTLVRGVGIALLCEAGGACLAA